VQRVREVREHRDAERVTAALEGLRRAAEKDSENLMPYLLEGTRALATEGEMVSALQQVFGTYTESPAF
jgi:methylmalonyl-CoA mutase, N-terminal domain